MLTEMSGRSSGFGTLLVSVYAKFSPILITRYRRSFVAGLGFKLYRDKVAKVSTGVFYETYALE